MPEPPDLPTLAKRYVELWQDYLTAAAGDPALADVLARLFAGMETIAGRSPWQAWLRAAAMQPGQQASGPDGDIARPAASPDVGAVPVGEGQAGESQAGEPQVGEPQIGDGERAGRPVPPARAPSAAAPSHERDDGLAELARGLARLDERLAALEAGKQPG